MIHVFLGTKAQLIKTAPVIRRLDADGVPYRLIDAGQHADLSETLRRELGIREPDVRLRRGASIATVARGAWWLARLLCWATVRPRAVRRTVFADQPGVCLIHGDTASTLVALYLAKRAGLRVAHLEAGLRSYSLWHPFPEELIRLIAMRGSDLLFAPSDWAFDNLKRMRVRGECVNLGANTNVEATREALARSPAVAIPSEPYALVAIHRFETIYHPHRLRLVVDLVLACADERLTLFILHAPTRRQLVRRGWLPLLEQQPRLQLHPLLPHHDFLHLARAADLLITDGGSIQEEGAYLGVPTLVLRRRTERREGLTAGVRLVPFDLTAARRALCDARSWHGAADALAQEPSRTVVESLRLMDGAPPRRATTPRAGGLRAWCWTVAGLAAIGVVLVHRWSAVPPVAWRWNPSRLAVSLALLVVSFEWGAWLWWRWLIHCGATSASQPRAAAIWFKALPAKYLPGGLWGSLGRLDLCRAEGWPMSAVGASLVLEQLSALVAATLVASGWLATGRWWWVGTIGCAAAALAAARPERLVSTLMRRMTGRGEGEGWSAPPGTFLRMLLGYLGYWAVHGAAFALFLWSLVPMSPTTVPTAIGAFAASFVVGYLVLFAPAGLGVREGMLAALLSARWPAGTALVASVLARVWIVIGETISVVAHGLAARRAR